MNRPIYALSALMLIGFTNAALATPSVVPYLMQLHLPLNSSHNYINAMWTLTNQVHDTSNQLILAEYTKFRGISLGSTEQEITEALRTLNFDNLEIQRNKELTGEDAEKFNVFLTAVGGPSRKIIGRFVIDSSDHATELTLYSTFFDAQDLPMRDFARAIVDNYHIDKMDVSSCRGYSGIRHPCFVGLSPGGEKLVIEIIDGAQFISLKVTSTAAPQFN